MQLARRDVKECSTSIGSDCNLMGKCEIQVANISSGIKEMLIMIGTW